MPIIKLKKMSINTIKVYIAFTLENNFYFQSTYAFTLKTLYT